MAASQGRPGAAEVALAAEAAVVLAAASAIRRSLRSRRWHRLLGAPVPVPELPATVPSGVEADLQRAIERGTRRLPWQVNCLDQAIAGQLMLRLRRRPGVAVVGLRPGSAWESHAWLVGRSGTIVGGPASAGFTPVSAFRPRGRGTG